MARMALLRGSCERARVARQRLGGLWCGSMRARAAGAATKEAEGEDARKQHELLEKRLQNMRKKGSNIRRANEMMEHMREIKKMPTGFLSLDISLGGGIPLRGVTEIFGEESVGKTTLGIQILANALERDKERSVLFIDAENTYSESYMIKGLGVNDTDRFIHYTPENMQKAFNDMHDLISTGCISMVLLDSLAMLEPKELLDEGVGEGSAGLSARITAAALKKLNNKVLPGTGTGFIMINQFRNKIDMFNPKGQSKQTTGGYSLRYYTFLRLHLKSAGQPSEHMKPVQTITHKNKAHKPRKSSNMTLINGEGFDRIDALVQGAVSFGVIKKSGAWYHYNNEKFHGTNQLTERLKADQDLYEQIQKDALEQSEHPDALNEQDHVGLKSREPIDADAEAEMSASADGEGLDMEEAAAE